MSQTAISEYQSRVQRAREIMSKNGIDAIVVTEPINYYYFTGHKSPSWMKSRPAIFILPLEGDAALINWSGPEMFCRLYNKPFPSWVEDKRFYPEVPFTMDKSVDWGIKTILEEKHLEEKTIGIEMGQETWLGITFNDFIRLKEDLPKAKFIESGPVIWGCRMIKSEWEINASRNACEIGGKAWKRCLGELKVGMSIQEIKMKIQQYYFEEGADLDSPPVTAFGATGPEGTFQKGDILYLDGGPSFCGYKMDFTRRAVFGKPSDRQLQEHNTMWEILFKVMDQMKPGVPLKKIFEFSQAELSKTKFKNYSDHPAKRIGHGIGLDNEPPAINGIDPTILQKGMILTPEPKIESVDGLVNPEEHIVIIENGYEQLSTIPNWELFIVK